MAGNFELKWSDFGDNLSSSFKDLREDGDLLDVTLVCDDEQLEAHKIILSASSVFFKSVIKRNPHAHPLIYLKGVKIDDMRALIDFMYLGQTKVCQDDVQAFLALGEELGVKGLARDKQIGTTGKENLSIGSLVEHEEDEREEKKTNESISPYLEIKTEDQLNIDVAESSVNCTNIMPGEDANQLDMDTTAASDMEELCADMSFDANLNAQIENNITKTTNTEGLTGYQCTTCNKFSKNKQNLKKHVEIHMEGLSFPCKLCDRTYKTRNTFHSHMYTKHRILKKIN